MRRTPRTSAANATAVAGRLLKQSKAKQDPCEARHPVMVGHPGTAITQVFGHGKMRCCGTTENALRVGELQPG